LKDGGAYILPLLPLFERQRKGVFGIKLAFTKLWQGFVVDCM
jgi:hypothetical protein